MNNFQNFGLSENLNVSLRNMDYKTPTPIQEQAIPLAIEGHDILGSAQTGTGKTAAFSIPLVESLLRNPDACALVLTPTRELAKQVLDVIHDLLGRDSNINTAFIIGGEAYGKQMAQLRANPRIVVGTPGRINDHLQRKSIDFRKTGFLVLDETDRMLDMGFGVQLDKIIKYLPHERQTLMFSATLPQGIVKLSSKYLSNPKRISVGETNVIATNIKQEVIRIEQGDKYRELQVQLNERQGSVIVFIKTKHGADKMAKKLRQDGFTSEALHGDLRQNKRDKVMRNFRDMNFRVMIATDIAARGLDVPHIEHVINYDLPQVAEDYIHRMGRTARAGAKGSAVSFVASQDGRKWHAIECLLDPEAKKKSNDNQGRRKGKSRGKPFNKGRGERSDRDDNRSGKNSNAKYGAKSRRGRKEERAQSSDQAQTKKYAHKRSEKQGDDRSDKRNDTRSENGFDKRKKPFRSDSDQPQKKKGNYDHAKKRGERSGNSFSKDHKPKSGGDKARKTTGGKPNNFKSAGSSPMKRRSKDTRKVA